MCFVSEAVGSVVFFFFQGEDGIRDKLVTGVQTCALPICLDMPGHIKHRDGDTFSEVYLSYRGRVPSSEFLKDFPPDRKSVGKGKSVDLGGRGIFKKKKIKICKWQCT